VFITFFSFALAIIFFSQLAFGTLVFIYREKVKNEGEKQLMIMIQSYRDDPDLQNMIDWIQRDWLHCCGVNNYRNWESNIYFNCSSKIVGSIEACGVPSSCCRTEYFHNNKQCGYGTLEPSAATHMIYTEGCLPKASHWFERHILPVAIVIVILAVLQILSICFAQNLRNDILAQKAKWTWQAHPMMNYYRH
jgi:tetraspanin-5